MLRSGILIKFSIRGRVLDTNPLASVLTWKANTEFTLPLSFFEIQGLEDFFHQNGCYSVILYLKTTILCLLFPASQLDEVMNASNATMNSLPHKSHSISSGWKKVFFLSCTIISNLSIHVHMRGNCCLCHLTVVCLSTLPQLPVSWVLQVTGQGKHGYLKLWTRGSCCDNSSWVVQTTASVCFRGRRHNFN